MKRDEDTQISGTMNDYLVQRMTDEQHGQEFTIEYLKADFLASAANALSSLRHQAGLTQAQLAERLNTKQSAIARLEADFDGAISLRRYIDFALACGFIPHHITFVPLVTAGSFTLAQPDRSLTFENQQNWMNTTFQLTLEPVGTTSQMTFTVSTSVTTLKEPSPKSNIVATQLQPHQLQEKVAA
ncbi:MAG TPA: helix-turn-helix transcriptional regulator [Ktedonobacteraceae bacterium]|jgi:DNA-binding XRE family transcriptional regulator|nr:helix-turn-helix transcriptional regulator [Ktedonobacteraceae bacterium]